MDVHVTDDQIGRYFRRIQLALRFLAHGARAQTTSEWSGLTPDQLVTLRRRWMFNSEERLRGPSPSSFQVFFSSAKTSSQAALFVSICRAVGAAKAVASLENGEKLCEAFEVYREWEPQMKLEFEQAVLLMTGAVRAEKIELGYCSNCHRALLIDKLGRARSKCPRCRTTRSRATASARKQGDEPVVQEQNDTEGER
jgi:hypothetical protein